MSKLWSLLHHYSHLGMRVYREGCSGLCLGMKPQQVELNFLTPLSQTGDVHSIR